MNEAECPREAVNSFVLCRRFSFWQEGLTTVTKRELRAVNQHVRMWDENFMVQVSRAESERVSK